LSAIKIRDYTCGMLVTIVGLAFYSYYVRELLSALTLFSVAFFVLALVGLGALLVWCAGVQVAIWVRPASRNVIAFSRRLIEAYARP
jgi:high-affinity K+ transport system ATPase subunit B